MSETLKTMNIKGKPYVLVNERIKAFRTKYAGWSLETEIVELTNERCTMRAVIKDENGVVKATGTAYETAGSSYINKTSYVENCETSAWGRALGNLGIGIDTSIASAEEMDNAVANQLIDEHRAKIIDAFLNRLEEKTAGSKAKILKGYKVNDVSELTNAQYADICARGKIDEAV